MPLTCQSCAHILAFARRLTACHISRLWGYEGIVPLDLPLGVLSPAHVIISDWLRDLVPDETLFRRGATTNMERNISHPYFPRSLKLPHFKPNDKDLTELLSTFFGIVAVFIVLTWLLTGRARKPLSLTRRLVVCWFVACGFIHSVLEGYFGYFHATLAGQMDFLAQLCKTNVCVCVCVCALSCF